MDKLKGMSKGRKIVFICLWCLVFFFICVAIVVFLSLRQIGKEFWGSFENYDVNSQPWVECPIELPNKTGRIIFMQRQSHPFLTEYYRKLRFEMSKFQEHIEKELPPNTGGKTKINIYYYEVADSQGPYIKFQDRFGNYYFDLSQNIKDVPHIPNPEIFTKRYFGRIEGTKTNLEFINAEKSKEERIEMLK